MDQLPTDDPAFHWSDARIEIGAWSFAPGAALTRFADGDRAAAAIVATADRERLLFGDQPFSSRARLPDDFVYSSNGPRAMGFFGPTWQFDATLGARRD